jgi:flagellar biosynthesis/type III secretory pathway protein FliH
MDPIIRAPVVADGVRQLIRPTAPVSVAQPIQAEAADVGAERMPKAREFAGAVAAAMPQSLVQPQTRLQTQVPLQEHSRDIRHKLEAEVREDIAKVRDEAESQGFEVGLKRGEEVAAKAIAQQLERLTSICKALQDARPAALAAAEDSLVEVAYTAICRVIGENAASVSGVAQIVSKAIEAVNHREQLIIHLDPDDANALAQAMEGHAPAAKLPATAVVRADPAIKMGGCTVETASGTLDAQLDVQLERLRDCLVEVRSRRLRELDDGK